MWEQSKKKIICQDKYDTNHSMLNNKLRTTLAKYSQSIVTKIFQNKTGGQEQGWLRRTRKIKSKMKQKIGKSLAGADVG